MPGGIGFVDVTDFLQKSTEDMEPGELLSMEGFGLTDAMSALEIMDPRMDTGISDPPPSFDPNMPLLPSEVCWMLDRSFAYEMSWHSGFALSQTVYALRYVHHLGDITLPRFKVDTETWFSQFNTKNDDLDRPLELIHLVLRAGIFGLLKCCDLVWRELAQDHLIDGEDWSSEKFGVSLCENIQPEYIMSLIEEALNWLRQATSLPSSPWREGLINRLLLRRVYIQNLLQTLAFSSFPALHEAHENIMEIIAGLTPPEPPTAVLNALDPNISRRLVSFAPTRTAILPPQSEVWNAILAWIEQWCEIKQVVGTENLWNVLAGLRAYEDQPLRRTAFLRSCSISTFFNGSSILLTHSPSWLIDQLFTEIAAIPSNILTQQAAQFPLAENLPVVSTNVNSGQMKEADCLATTLTEDLLVDYFVSFYHNRPRQRRKLVFSLLDWHVGFERAAQVIARFASIPSHEVGFALSRIPLCIRHMRLLIISEIILSGFELELYARHEWAMMYWYLSEVLGSQASVLDRLQKSLQLEDDVLNVRNALRFISVQQEYTHALRDIAAGMRDMFYRYPPSKVEIEPSREQANFEKRFKWAFIPGYSEAATLDEDRPILSKWRRWRKEQQVIPHCRDQNTHCSYRFI
ncbi:Mak10 subunit, NatC N-terminal acetyltransferase-domain-containing protein [Hysterangium stoloniferum]|nr:Mak10 subunit, NatC N-terminal acetyltransferase-domain-containing protein [Hysterangium stoloniferum]